MADSTKNSARQRLRQGRGWIERLDKRHCIAPPQKCHKVAHVATRRPTYFEIVRSKAGDCRVGVFCHGTQLEQTRVIERDECRYEVMLEWPERIIEGDLDTVANSLLKRDDEGFFTQS